MDYKLAFQLLFSLFSVDPKNMRWFGLRRIFVALFLIPFFMLILVLNRFFMLLDYVFFPFFVKQKIQNPVFIVAAPRSATTYLLHVLANKQEQFTAFRLWEIIFAPSVIQKYIFLGIAKADRLFGSLLKKSIHWFEHKLSGKFSSIHLIGLNMPEEDEAILLWNVSTIYLNFFFPDTEYFKKYIDYDAALPPRLRKRINRYYLNCVKRHNYVFNRNSEKRFLSKNPVMMGKVKMLHDLFPDAVILNINRNPAKVIPSTLALNDAIYAVFTSHKQTETVRKQTIDLLVHWYKSANTNLKQYFKDQFLEIDFEKLVRNDETALNEIARLLNLPKGSLGKAPETSSDNKHKSSNVYQLLSGEELSQLLAELPFLSKYCQAKT
ncbi:MAG: sulfotransferase family protein [Bacteroidia bacterium]